MEERTKRTITIRSKRHIIRNLSNEISIYIYIERKRENNMKKDRERERRKMGPLIVGYSGERNFIKML